MIRFWKLIFTNEAKKKFLKIDSFVQKRIINYFDKNVLNLQDPLILAKPLTGQMSGLWRYRIQDYRVIVAVDKKSFVIVAVEVGHRKNVYI
jgi:mRNA interferase RelE/StbE